MALTKTEIKTRVATDYLSLIQLNQSLESQDSTRLGQGYDEVYADLKNKGLASWASTDSVPNELAPHVIALVAKNCYKTYKPSAEKISLIEADALIAESSIRALINSDYISQQDPVDY